jgi:rhomboid protease GluP
MDDVAGPGSQPDPSLQGSLTRAEAARLLQRADELLAAGDFLDAGRHYARVVGTDDAPITAAALLGLGEARYRLDDEDGAMTDWQAVIKLPETPSTYAAWRNIAAAHVRAQNLSAAIGAYRQADRRAPLDDKAEIANRLGWLTKETGDTGAARRYFARGRGDGLRWPLSRIILLVTVVISLSATLSVEGFVLFDALALDKAAVADGEYWRLWSVTLLHAGYLHLAFNMYALWIAGPIVERWYGPVRFLVFYLTCAAAGSVASFAFGPGQVSVGASGAIFGLFGLLLAAGRLHNPVDRQSRAIVGQLGMVIVLNLVLGFAAGGQIDNAAHIGGLVAGLWLGAVIPPTRISTLSSIWRRAGATGMDRVARPPAAVPVLAVVVVVGAVVVGLVYGTSVREGRGRQSELDRAPTSVTVAVAPAVAIPPPAGPHRS